MTKNTASGLLPSVVNLSDHSDIFCSQKVAFTFAKFAAKLLTKMAVVVYWL
jgi:hypothetical protein